MKMHGYFKIFAIYIVVIGSGLATYNVGLIPTRTPFVLGLQRFRLR